MPAHWIPVFLAISTGFGVVASLVLGKLYDRLGLPVLLVAVLLSSGFSPLVFLGGFSVALVGMLLWGIGYATQDTLLKAVVAGVLPEGQRNLAFGLFYAGYGVGWLVGSIAALCYAAIVHLRVDGAVAAALAKRDKTLRKVIDSYHGETMRLRGDPFFTLARLPGMSSTS